MKSDITSDPLYELIHNAAKVSAHKLATAVEVKFEAMTATHAKTPNCRCARSFHDHRPK